MLSAAAAAISICHFPCAMCHQRIARAHNTHAQVNPRTAQTCRVLSLSLSLSRMSEWFIESGNVVDVLCIYLYIIIVVISIICHRQPSRITSVHPVPVDDDNDDDDVLVLKSNSHRGYVNGRGGGGAEHARSICRMFVFISGASMHFREWIFA